jgi:hypothetical protein
VAGTIHQAARKAARATKGFIRSRRNFATVLR